MTHTAIPHTVLMVPLRPTHRIIVHFILPPFMHLVIFSFELATSITFCWCLLARANFPILMGITTSLIFLPAIVTAVTTITRGSKENGLARKVAIAIILSFAFPIWTVYRLTVRLFWAIDALLILHRQGGTIDDNGKSDLANATHKWGPRGKEVEEALDYSIEPSSAELYLFLRAFLFSLPNAFLNSAIIMAGWYDVDFAFETYRVEAANAIFSLIYLSMTAAYYQHFQSQYLQGREFPWRGKLKRETVWKKKKSMEKHSGDEEKGQKNVADMGEEQVKKIYADMDSEQEIEGSQKDSLSKDVEGSSRTDDEKEKEGKQNQSSPTSSRTSLEVILRHPPVLPELGVAGTYRGFTRPVPNEPAPPPPTTRPPRVPGGFRDIFCDSVSTNANSVRLSSAPSTRSTLLGWQPSFRSLRQSFRSSPLPHTPAQGVFPALPTRSKPKKIIKLYSMEHDDAIGLCVSFSHWLLLLIARAVTLGTAFNYFPKPTAGLCGAHILVLAIWLVRREGPPYFSPSKLLCRFSLAALSVSGVLIELGCLMFSPTVPVLHEMLIIAEDLALGLAWTLSGVADSWWHSFTFHMCIGGHLLSISCLIVYLIALRPSRTLITKENVDTEKEMSPLMLPSGSICHTLM
ncbi:uncharacterized protein LOC124167784 isoform X2 [Ischnura elegans]|uniref:uncharacterized protein LOC124167784 isoform X2 n=1 Tax=Ischnura elegans TaxID=197161 RepID=UPI001ED8BE15|nr:uncharacterized protein LOC124167784 isoform X2 [Ischnura elegans]